YVAGLVRDIGRLALLIKYPREYENLVAVSGENHYDLTATERELFDVDHCEAGAWLIRRMPMPAELADVVAGHHRAPVAGEPFRMTNLVRIADRMADALGFFVLTPIEPLKFAEVAQEFAELSGSSFDEEREDLRV